MSRNQRVELKFNKEEYDKIKQKAERNGMKLGTYIRFICLSSRILVKKFED